MENLKRVMTRIQLLFFGTICSFLIILFSIAGCSDPSSKRSIATNIGTTLTPAGLDDYITTSRGGRYCIHNDTDSACIDLIRHVNGRIDSNGPIIHIYPERTQYLFYYEGKPIVRIERPGDTTDIIDTITKPDPNPPKGGPSTPRDDDGGDDGNGDNGDDGNGDNGDDGNGDNGDDGNGDNGDDGNGDNGDDGNGDNGDDGNGDNGDDGNGDNGDDGNGDNGDDGNGDNGDDGNGDNGDDGNGDNGDDGNGDNGDNGNGDDENPTNNGNDGHGWLIWIYYPEGKAPINPPTLSKSNVVVTINSKVLTDDDITGFAQFIGTDGQRGIQFFYPTESAELLDLKVQMDGIVDQDGNVRFNINYLWYSY